MTINEEQVKSFDELYKWYLWLDRRTHDGIVQNQYVQTFLKEIRSLIPGSKDEIERLKYERDFHKNKSKEWCDLYYKTLRQIDCHIRSTGESIPYIVEVLKENLPEYKED